MGLRPKRVPVFEQLCRRAYLLQWRKEHRQATVVFRNCGYIAGEMSSVDGRMRQWPRQYVIPRALCCRVLRLNGIRSVACAEVFWLERGPIGCQLQQSRYLAYISRKYLP